MLDDVAVLLAPVDPVLVAERLARLRGAPLLRGARGRPGVDTGALAALVAGLGAFLVANPDVEEVDLNPVIASPAGAIAVDALIVVEGPAAAR
jgi:hypothetical protein